MSQIFNRTSGHGSVRPNRSLGTTWAMMTGMVALLVLAGTTVVSAEKIPTESVTGTIDLTDTDRQEFVDLFVQLLRDMFAGRIDNHADQPECHAIYSWQSGWIENFTACHPTMS